MSAKERFLRLQALYRSGQYAEASRGLAQALQTAPKDPNLLHLAALVAEAQDERPRAVLMLRRALAVKPDWFDAAYNLARILSAKGDLPEAITAWRRVLALRDEPEWRSLYELSLRQVCDWSEPPIAVDALPPQAVTILCDDPALQKQAAVRYAREKFGTIPRFPAAPDTTKPERLRVGYLSADFHAHATAYLIAELFELHDRTRFEVFAYSYGIDDRSAIRARLREQVEHFIELDALTAAEAAARIRQDEIDILIDLKGYTRGSRPEILAHRPAPLQWHWLGYPGTTGADFIDGFIGDAVTIPLGEEKHFTERVLRLPHCYQVNDRQRAVGPTLPRGAYGLPPRAFVFASFNQTYKITPALFALWCEILRAIPDAVLWLYQSNPYAPDNLRRAATGHGIDPARLIFAPPLPLEEHLARYVHVDLALDTFPVGGHTTTSDALWTGTPVVTLAGQSFVSRVAASLLTAAEMPQLVTTTFDAYKNTILRLARDPTERETLKQHLRDRRLTLPLFDTPRFVQDFENLLLQTTSAPPRGEG